MTAFAEIEARLNAIVLGKLSNATAVINGVAVDGVFDARHDEALGISGNRPLFTANSPVAASVQIEATIAVSCETLGLLGAPYVVIEKQPDHGITRLILERAA